MGRAIRATTPARPRCAADGVKPPSPSQGKERYFSGRHERRPLEGVGHFPPREAPAAVVAGLLAFLHAC